MQTKRNKFKEVSYFSKVPLFNRNSFLLLFILCMTMIEIILFERIEKVENLIFFTLIVISLTALFIKKWAISKIHFERTPYKKLKQFIHDNKLYESEVREVGTLKNGSPKKKTIVYNSVYFSYQYTDDGELIIRALKKADKFSDKANTYNTMLPALLGLPIYKKIDDIQYCDYVFELIPDKRIIVSSNTERTSSTIIKITNKISYDISKVSHGLTVGSTGSGKSFYVNSKILDYVRMGAELYIADPKSADLSLIRFVKGFGKDRVASEPHQIAQMLREVTEIMESRYRECFNDVSAFGKTFVDFSLPPVVVVIDEWAAFINSVDKKLRDECSKYLLKLILKGRTSGCFVELILQRPDTSFIEGSVRDSIGCRIALSNMSKQGYEMCFGSSDVDYKTITTKGGGYIKIDGLHNEPVYFETPLIQKNFNFLEELQNIVNSHPTFPTTKTIEIGRQTH